jgi:acetyl esterase
VDRKASAHSKKIRMPTVEAELSFSAVVFSFMYTRAQPSACASAIARLLMLIAISAGLASAQDPGPVSGPEVKIYKTVGTMKLAAHVFRPAETRAVGRRPAIVLFHGGGWIAGSPEWVYDAARRFASHGAVSVAAEYRLSDQKTVTPVDAMADARDIVLWMRRNAELLGIDPDRIAAFGVSAGGQLAASLATFDDRAINQPSAVPNAMLLISPAVSLGQDGWFQKILCGRATAADVSPDEHIDRVLPPTAIFIGGVDTLTPVQGVRRYCDSIKEHGGQCELHVYDGVGHLFTRKLDNQQDEFDPDPKVVLDARIKGDQFLAQRGFLNSEPAQPEPPRR